MSKYIHFTDEEKERAYQTDIADLLVRQGETIKRSGSEYEWKDGSQKVTIRGNLWYHQYEQKGGNAIDFVKRFYGKTYPEAVEFLIGTSVGEIKTIPLKTSPFIEKPKGKFKLPPRNDNMRRVFAYLVYSRGIDKDIFSAFAYKKMIYESQKYHNAVFVGFDKSGNAKHANMRGIGKDSTFKGNAPSSTPECSFHWTGTDEKIFFFEAPIDMLSFISMHKENWRKHSYAAACSVSDRVLMQMLKDNPKLSKVYLCLDSDTAGQEAANRISDKLSKMNIDSAILVPFKKDWNEDILFYNQEKIDTQESEAEENCQVLQY